MKKFFIIVVVVIAAALVSSWYIAFNAAPTVGFLP